MHMPNGVDRVALLRERVGRGCPKRRGRRGIRCGWRIGSPRRISPRPWATMLRRRSATMRGSSCFSVPAVALRGLANGSSPAATTASVHPLELGQSACRFRRELRAPPESGISLSAASASGIARIVRTFCVTSSPRWPSPRVAARTSWPSLVAKIDGDAIDFRIGDVAAGDREAGAVGLVVCRIVFFSQLAATFFALSRRLCGPLPVRRRSRAAWDRRLRTPGRPICGGRPHRTCCRSKTSAARGRPCESPRSARRRRAAWGYRA